MATNKNKSNGNEDTAQKNPKETNLKFLINAQYLKDLSFENPKAPNSLGKFLVIRHQSFKLMLM